jgi:hypothetical protein
MGANLRKKKGKFFFFAIETKRINNILLQIQYIATQNFILKVKAKKLIFITLILKSYSHENCNYYYS